MTITNLLIIIGIVLTIPISALVGVLGIVKIIETKRKDNENEQ